MKAGGVTTPLEARQGKAFLLLDPIREHYLLMKMGWYQDNRIKSNVIHVRLKDGKIWSQLPSIKRSTAMMWACI